MTAHADWKNYERHPAHGEYRDMTEAEYAHTRASIETLGVLDPIGLLDGKVFDGWHRFIICREVGIKPPFMDLAEGMDGEAYHKAVNLCRRHLTPREVAAMMVGKLPPKEARAKRRKSGLKRGKKSPVVPLGTTEKTSDISTKPPGASDRTVARAKADLEKVASAIPEVQKAVAKGEVKPQDAAAIADKPPAVQAAALERVAKGTAPTLRKAVAGDKGKAVKPGKSDFSEVETIFGKLVRATTVLSEKRPADKFHRAAKEYLNSYQTNLDDWKRAHRA